jgi:conjugal transfer mating pair stabilization protein TraN
MKQPAQSIYSLSLRLACWMVCACVMLNCGIAWATKISVNPIGPCKKLSSVCVQGAETRNINGVMVYKECWQMQDNYACIDPVLSNNCQPLEDAGCAQISSVCAASGFDGSCLRFTNTYQCSQALVSVPSNIEQLASTFTITRDEVNVSACAVLAGSNACRLQTEVCSEGAATRNINGLDVFKSCWKWERTYTCPSTAMQSDCQDLLADSNCTETSSTCILKNPDGSCSSIERRFNCRVRDATSTPVTSCAGQTFCNNGQCFDTSYTPDADFARASTGMEVVREGGTYFDPATMKLFNGTADFCRKTFGSIGNCCKLNPNQGMSNRNASQAAGIALRVGGEAVRAGSAYAFDALFNGAGQNFLSQGFNAMLGSASSMGNIANPFGAASFSSSFSFYGMSFSMGAEGLQFVSFDPWTFAAQIAIQIVIKLISCEQPEKVLGMKRGNNLCEFVGSWCSKEINYLFGTACIQHKESYCCFNSKLAKIINKGGKTQLRRDYGTAQAPNCSGFTANEMERLDFSQMDLAEFYGDLIKTMPDLAARTVKNTQLIQNRVTNYYSTGSQVPPALK